MDNTSTLHSRLLRTARELWREDDTMVCQKALAPRRHHQVLARYIDAALSDYCMSPLSLSPARLSCPFVSQESIVSSDPTESARSSNIVTCPEDKDHLRLILDCWSMPALDQMVKR